MDCLPEMTVSKRKILSIGKMAKRLLRSVALLVSMSPYSSSELIPTNKNMYMYSYSSF